MMAILAKIFAVAVTFSSMHAGGAEVAPHHDKEYWQEIIARDFTPPDDVPLPVLLRELSDNLASTDPELRDDISYGVLTQWLYVKKIVSPELRRDLASEWMENLRWSVGEKDTDSVLLRSFSALMLSVIVASDNETPYLDRDEFETLLDAAVDYMHDEQDTRGFDADMGWLHSVAHTADLMKFLARSRHLEVSEQSVILTSIALKLTSVDHVLDRGEDERLARVVLSLISRPDFDVPAFGGFVHMLQPLTIKGLPTPRALAVNQNRRNVAVSLYVVLAADKRELEYRRQASDVLLTFLRTIM
jgi:Protein of unknown function (DUF2785)